MPAQLKEINLLAIEEFEKTRFGRFLKWALSFGRWIVILTELTVILCFFSRFKLDRDLTDLGEKIKQQQAIIVSFGDFEGKFRNLQKRLKTIEQLEEKQLAAVQLLNEIAEIIPQEVNLEELAVREGGVEMTGVSLSEAGLGNFLKNLSESKFEKTAIRSVAKKETGEIEFQLITYLGDFND